MGHAKKITPGELPDKAKPRKTRAKKADQRTPEQWAAWKAMAGIRTPYERLPAMVRYGGDDKHVRVGDKFLVIRQFPRISFDLVAPVRLSGSKRSSWDLRRYFSIVVDLDFDISPAEWNAIFPGFEPAFLTGTAIPGSDRLRRPHALFFLQYGVAADPRTGLERSDKRRYERIHETIAARLRAAGHPVDPGQKVLTKNPDCEQWDTVAGPMVFWTLTQIEAALGIEKHTKTATVLPFPKMPELPGKPPVALTGQESGRVISGEFQRNRALLVGRNKDTFNAVRLAVQAQHWRPGITVEELRPVVHGLVDKENRRFPMPMKRSECNAIAKSITRFFVFKYRPNGHDAYNRGAAADLMHGTGSEAKRKSLGALYTNSKRSGESCQRVQDAKAELEAQGITPTKSGVARLLGMDRNTVKAYWDGVTPASVRAAEIVRSGAYLLTPADGIVSSISDALPPGESAAYQKMAPEITPHEPAYDMVDYEAEASPPVPFNCDESCGITLIQDSDVNDEAISYAHLVEEWAEIDYEAEALGRPANYPAPPSSFQFPKIKISGELYLS